MTTPPQSRRADRRPVGTPLASGADGRCPLRRPRLTHALVVAAYLAVFWGLLPWAIWRLAGWVDARWSCAIRPTAWGALPGAAGVGLLAAGAHALWNRGGGLPISALPPPRLVVGGVYRVVRHPLYLGFNLAMFGAGLLLGSAGLALVVAPLFLPVWAVYAAVEERGLRRRFGEAWRRYCRRTGWFPRPSLVFVARLLAALGVVRVVVLSGAEHLPRRGGAVLVANHQSYTDPVFLSLLLRRTVWFPTTAEVFRDRLGFGLLARWWPSIPVRRYRPDVRAARDVLDTLAAGEVVGVFAERERTVLGGWQGAPDRLAAGLARLGVPVVPVALQDSYRTGPRWAGGVGGGVVHVRVGAPLAWGSRSPRETLDAAFAHLLDEPYARVDLARVDLARLGRAVWRCPDCLGEVAGGWRPERLACGACGARWGPSGDGRVVRLGADGERRGGGVAFGAWAAPVWAAAETGPLRARARLLHEADPFGAIRPLVVDGDVSVEVSAEGVRIEPADPGGPPARWIPAETVRTTTTERADTLQLAVGPGPGDRAQHLEVLQLVVAEGSAFRLQRALDRGRREARGEPYPKPTTS